MSEEGGGETKTHVFSLIEKLNKINDVNTMYMYSLNFTVFYDIIHSELFLYVTFWH